MNTYVHWTRKELYAEWDRLLGIPEDQNRQRGEVEELQLADLTEALWPTPALLPVEIMRGQLEALERSLDEPTSKEAADEIYLQMVDLQQAIERENGAMDDYAFGRNLLKAGPL